jgi:YggT family protein
VGATVATFGLLADWVSTAQDFVVVFVGVYVLVIFAYILTSWIRLPYSLNPVQRFLNDVCEPYLRLFRRVLPSAGGIDFSPMLAIIALTVVDRLLIWILEHFH